MPSKEPPRRVSHWVPNQPLDITPLAWQAAYPELKYRATPWWTTLVRILSARSARRMSHRRAVVAEQVDGRMADYSMGVHVAAQRLNALEQAELKRTGTLPDWFFDAVEDARKDWAKTRR